MIISCSSFMYILFIFLFISFHLGLTSSSNLLSSISSSGESISFTSSEADSEKKEKTKKKLNLTFYNLQKCSWNVICQYILSFYRSILFLFYFLSLTLCRTDRARTHQLNWETIYFQSVKEREKNKMKREESRVWDKN